MKIVNLKKPTTYVMKDFLTTVINVGATETAGRIVNANPNVSTMYHGRFSADAVVIKSILNFKLKINN